MDSAHTLFLKSARYYLGVEYRTKLRHAVLSIPPTKLWWRPNESSNSAGNLVVHLTGNVSQWILSGIGGREYRRDRAGEFAAHDGAAAEVLLANLDAVLDQVDEVLAGIDEARLLEPAQIQGRSTTDLEAIFHVVEHFSTHLGQVILLSKSVMPGAVRFYEDAGGLAKPIWKDLVPPASGDERR